MDVPRLLTGPRHDDRLGRFTATRSLADPPYEESRMRTSVVIGMIAISGLALTWSCSGMRSGGSAGGVKPADKAAPEPQVAYTFLGLTSDVRGEMFPCG